MEQVIIAGREMPNTTALRYISLSAGHNWVVIEANERQIISTSGKIKNLRVYMTGSPGAGKHYDFTLMLNGAPTALTVQIADAASSGFNIVNEIDVVAGDSVTIQSDPFNTPTNREVEFTTMFEGATAKESLILGTTNGDALSTTATRYAFISGIDAPVAAENDRRQVCPTAGKIKNLFVELSADPGVEGTDAYRFTLRKGGISQTLTVLIVANDTTGSDIVNEVAVAAGDLLTMRIDPVETPSVSPNARWGMTFVADIDGESIILGGDDDDLNNAALEYNSLNSNADGWCAGEWIQQLGQKCTLTKLYVKLSAQPGVGNKYTFTIRIAVADSNVVAEVVDNNTTGNSGALSDTVADDDHIILKCVPDSTPNVADAYWGVVSYRAPPSGLEIKSAGMAAKMIAGKLL